MSSSTGTLPGCCRAMEEQEAKGTLTLVFDLQVNKKVRSYLVVLLTVRSRSAGLYYG